MGTDRSANADTRTTPERRPRVKALSDLRNVILQQKLRTGDPLPNEDLLAHSTGMSIFHVRAGVKALAALGILEVQSDGTSIISGQDSSTRTDLLRQQMALTEFSPRDLVDVRVQLETCAARRAALDATPAQLARLHELVQAMRAPHINRAQFNDLDDQFHAGIAAATTNALAAELMHALRDACADMRAATFAEVTDWTPTKRHLVAEHRRILTALANGEGEEAAAQLQHHIAGFYATSA